ncbi:MULTISPECIES: hypothetical protein [Rhizobium]|uniref:hypothetical protein n=1 Tax=Rhizobium TaxID=379 RepID=UPI001B321708|nr:MULTISPECIES: hypothetical protein [Rhizobium]MBX4911088.1 hypothetical protein [Rhizobium bangladeshense]MBX5216852.1 hypothetical protein [Rhizobium sp. NLR9a]MBX5228757.1 hypothetical protein [Rhizobium sp. NLR9b]MBX5235207.1 hypothetical protein [Rhizobium sp. NLR4a]MBX5247340.1 hypothetical protein [Rhizobium sp. NLR3b]
MKTAFELPFSTPPEKRISKAWQARQGRCGYPAVDISSFAFAALAESACHSDEGMF